MTWLRGRTPLTTARVLCNRLTYAPLRALASPPFGGWLHSRWHWYRFPFSLRHQVLWSPPLRCWFSPEDESAIECMLRLPSYEPVTWVAPQPGDVFVDIGAYIGWYTIQAARAVGPAGRVIALEPDPLNHRQLEETISLNGITNCEVLPLAAWSLSGSVGWRPGQEPVWHRVDAEGSAVVEAIRVDDLVGRCNLARVDWIKMDIEGGEIEALKGAAETLRNFRPTLFIEIHQTLEPLRSFLANFDYAFERTEFDHHGHEHGWLLARSAEAISRQD